MKHRRFQSDYLFRTLWLTMLAGHVPAVIRRAGELVAGAPEASFGTLVILAVSCVFFALKVAGTPWLRFNFDRRAMVGATVLVALLHTNVLTDPQSAPPATEQLAMIGGLGAAVIVCTAVALRRAADGRYAPERIRPAFAPCATENDAVRRPPSQPPSPDAPTRATHHVSDIAPMCAP